MLKFEFDFCASGHQITRAFNSTKLKLILPAGLYKVIGRFCKIIPKSLGYTNALPTGMMSFWRSLRYWPFGAFNANNDKTYDEENLRWGSGLPKCPRLNCRLIPRLRKATVVFLLIDLMVVGLLLQFFAPLITLLRRNEELFGSRVALPAPYRPDARYQMTSSGQIPRILHQTAATETIPNKWIESQQSCKEAYSDFEYKVILIPTL